MIDYEKLKECFDLAENIDCQFTVTLRFNRLEADLYQINYEKLSDGLYHKHDSYRDINECLKKLQELKQPKPKHKYERNSCMWTLSEEHEPEEFYIHLRDTADDGEQILYGNRISWKLEEELYLTKSELIEAQIDYWKNQLAEELEQDISPYCRPLGKQEAQEQNLSSCCSIHAGTLEECREEPELWKYKDYLKGLCAPTQFNKPKECQHEYKKTLDKSGMNVVSVCHKCLDMKIHCLHKSDGINYDNKTNEGHTYAAPENVHLKCIKCGERYGYVKCE